MSLLSLKRIPLTQHFWGPVFSIVLSSTELRSLPKTAGPELYVSVLLRVDRLRLEALNMFIILMHDVHLQSFRSSLRRIT